jgi:hypothetical protein
MPIHEKSIEMVVEHVATFPHRHNPNGSFDSICPKCFATVSSKRNETELAGDETNHDCLSHQDSAGGFRSVSLDYIAECLSVFDGTLGAGTDLNQ